MPILNAKILEARTRTEIEAKIAALLESLPYEQVDPEDVHITLTVDHGVYIVLVRWIDLDALAAADREHPSRLDHLVELQREVRSPRSSLPPA